MFRSLFYSFILLTALPGLAQKDSVRKYLNGNLEFTTRKNAVYAAMAVKEDEHWVLHAVYPDTAVLLRVYFKNAGLSIKDGPFELYHPKRIPAQKGYFKDNVPVGKWQTWYANGQLKNEGLIVNNYFSGVWKSWYESGQMMSEQSYAAVDAGGDAVHQFSPAASVEKIMDGFAPEQKLEGQTTTWYRNGNKESVLNYHNDSLSGTCTWFRENGNLSTKETYVNGRVNELACYDSTGQYTGATCSILKLPVLVHPFFTTLDYIENELHKEKNKGVQEGDVMVSFAISKKGMVENLVFISSPDDNLNKLIAHIFAGMPAWSPAVTHNRTVDYSMKLQIPYYRQ